MKKLILFDLDGTLLDTLPDIHACCNDVLRSYALPPITMEETRAFVGNGARKLCERMLKDRTELLDTIYPDYAERFKRYRDKTKLYPMEIETLARLRQKGFSFAVITNKPDEAAHRVIERFFGPEMPVAGQREGFSVKPDPALTEWMISSLGYTKSDCVFVGDGETDIATARNVGIPVVAVLWGNRSKEQLAGADAYARSFPELEQILMTI